MIWLLQWSCLCNDNESHSLILNNMYIQIMYNLHNNVHSVTLVSIINIEKSFHGGYYILTIYNISWYISYKWIT